MSTFTPSLYSKAIAASGSRNACSVKGVMKRSVTLNADASIAAFASPRVTWRKLQRLPFSWSLGASSAIASHTFVTGLSTS